MQILSQFFLAEWGRGAQSEKSRSQKMEVIHIFPLLLTFFTCRNKMSILHGLATVLDLKLTDIWKPFIFLSNNGIGNHLEIESSYIMLLLIQKICYGGQRLSI